MSLAGGSLLAGNLREYLFHVPLDHAIVVLFDGVQLLLTVVGIRRLSILSDRVAKFFPQRFDRGEYLGSVGGRPIVEFLPAS